MSLFHEDNVAPALLEPHLHRAPAHRGPGDRGGGVRRQLWRGRSHRRSWCQVYYARRFYPLVHDIMSLAHVPVTSMSSIKPHERVDGGKTVYASLTPVHRYI